jgi:tripartite-type tricarboxylate transporter receptor subunit TctC
MLPVKTPKETVDYLNKEMVKAMADHDVADKLTKLGLTPQASSPQELQKLYDEDVTRWQDVISQAHIAKQ